jgi:uncharacterized protein
MIKTIHILNLTVFIASFVMIGREAFANEKAGFDCKKAHSQIEKRICSDPLLARKDLEVSNQYKKIKASTRSSFESDQIIKEQRAWLAKRDKLCKEGTKICLSKEYSLRLDELKNWEKVLEAGQANPKLASPRVESGTTSNWDSHEYTDDSLFLSFKSCDHQGCKARIGLPFNNPPCSWEGTIRFVGKDLAHSTLTQEEKKRCNSITFKKVKSSIEVNSVGKGCWCDKEFELDGTYHSITNP